MNMECVVCSKQDYTEVFDQPVDGFKNGIVVLFAMLQLHVKTFYR